MGFPFRRRLTAWLSGAPASSPSESLYAAALRQSRTAALFARLGVPDTLDGRFDSLALHVGLLVRRLSREPEGVPLIQALYDSMFDDMDRTLREMGVGDLGVGKRVQRMGEALMGRISAYGTALDSDDATQLADALRRNLFGTVAEPAADHIDALAAYVRAVAQTLSAQSLSAMLKTGPDFGSIKESS